MESVAMASNTRIQSEKIVCKKGQTLPYGSQMVEFVHRSFITVDSTQVVLSSLTGEILNNLIQRHFGTF